jgi:diadenosine tetraphosphate (Ap4A) HIT family hydrolase
MLTSPAVEWPPSFYELRRGEGCPACSEGRPEEMDLVARIFAGQVSDAYLRRADIQRGYTISIWRGRHVAEPTELTDDEAAAYWLEVVHVARALEEHFRPVKTNYEVLGNALPHLHTHLILRYADDPRPGGRFPSPRRHRRRSRRRASAETSRRSARCSPLTRLTA